MRSQRSLKASGFESHAAVVNPSVGVPSANFEPFGCSAGAPPRFRLRVFPPATFRRIARLSCDEMFQFTKSDESVQLNVRRSCGGGDQREVAERSIRLSLRL